ncbi:MAG: hypothetical protein AB4368_18100 [Xenococcaceae cyanobacterium]
MSTTQSPGIIVGKGSVGEESNTATIEYKFESNRQKLMIVRTVETNLCPDTGAFAFLFRNGQEVTNGSITELGSSIQAEAEPGDRFAVFVTLYPLFNEVKVFCEDLGNLNFNFIEIDFLP